MKTLIILILLAVGAVAQGVTTADLQSKAKQAKHGKKILVTYDKFKDQTVVAIKPFNLISGMESFAVGMADSLARSPHGSGRPPAFPTALYVSVSHSYKGPALEKTPEQYFLMLTSNSGNWLFLKGDRNLYFLFDEQRLELKIADSDSDINRRDVSETLVYLISADDLKRLTDAKKVEMKIGQVPRKLKPELFTIIREIMEVSTVK